MRPRSMLRLVCLLSLLGGLMVTVAPARADGERLTWNLASDFSLSPDQANPNPDGHGELVWAFMQGTNGHDPSTYALLPEFISDAFSISGLQQWQDTFESGGPKDKLPAVGINATGSAQQVFGIAWPLGVVRMHPLHNEAVVVGWRSPIDGAVQVHGMFADLDPTCGDGIRWSVAKGAVALTSGSWPNGGSAEFNGVAGVSRGDFLYFIVDAGRNSDAVCDSTSLRLAIRSVDD